MERPSYNVLLVEERDADAQLVEEALLQCPLPCTVTHVRRLSDALEQTLNTSFDIVLLDLFLSDSRGLDTFVAMRSHAPRLPMILLSDSTSLDITSEAAKKGAQDILNKDEISSSILGKTLTYAIERKRHELELLRQKEFYENLLQEANVWVEALDRAGNVILWNSGAEDISGYSSRSMLHSRKRWERLYPDEEYRQQLLDNYKLLIREERNLENFETEIRTAAGETRVISWNTNIIRSSGEQAAGCMLIGNDVTDRKASVQEISRSEDRFRILADMTSDYVYSARVSEDFIVTTEWIEGAFQSITTYDPKEFIERPGAWWNVIHPEDRERFHDFGSTLMEDEPTTLEYRILGRDREVIWIRDHIFPLRDAEGRLTGLHGAAQDITRSKEAEQRLVQANETMRALIDATDDYAFLLNREGAVVLINKVTAAALNTPPEELVGRNLLDFLPEEIADERRSKIRELLSNREAAQYVTEHRSHIYHVHVTPLPDEPGAAGRIAVFARDITQKQIMEESLLKEQEKLRGIIENAADGIALMNAEGKLIEWSPAMERITGISREEALTLSHWDIQQRIALPEERDDEELRRRSKEELLQFMSDKDSPYLNRLFDRWIQRPDGTRRYIEMVSFPVYSSEGLLTGSVTRDITEIKLAELDLEEKNQQLQTLIQAIPDIVYFKDGQLRTVIANQAHDEYVNSSMVHSADAAGRASAAEGAAAIDPSDRNVLESGLPVRREEAIEDRDSDASRYFETIRVPIRNAAGDVTGLVGVSRDITERKVAELLLEEQNKELKERNQELDTYTHSVAHDLKNPLSLILGYAELAQSEGGELSEEELREYMGSILFNGRKMISIINALLLLASVRKEEITLNVLDMAQIVDDAIRRLHRLIDSERIKVLLPDRWISALGYAPWIEEVWVNYIGNAIKHGGKNISVEIGLEEEGDMVRYWVRDNGPGIPADRLHELFVPFTRLSQAKIEGHGLGLSIVRRIVEKIGGSVHVESEYGKGSTFYFSLPAAS